MEDCDLLSWNIRGLGRERNRKNLATLIRKNQLRIVCIQETKQEFINEQQKKEIWDDTDIRVVMQTSTGLSGGIMTFWNNELIELQASVSQSGGLGCKFKERKKWEVFIVINIYAPQDKGAKIELLENLSICLSKEQDTPIIIVGDFNMVKAKEEMLNCEVDSKEIEVFNDWLNSNNLVDLPIVNANYSWIGRENKRSRIDRMVMNISFHEKASWNLKALSRLNSDHRALFLAKYQVNWGPKPFRMFNVWLKNKSLVDIIMGMFAEHGASSSLQVLLRKIRILAKEWNKEMNGNIYSKISLVESKLADAKEECASPQVTKALQQELEELELVRNSMLRQKARINWLKEGDSNTKFFHHCLQKRKAKNNLTKLRIGGQILQDPLLIKQEAVHFFRNLYA